MVFAASAFAAEQEPPKLGKNIEDAAENIAPAFHNPPKDVGNIPTTFPYQPPLVPHSIRGLQVTKNVNQCLMCHGLDVYKTTGAPRAPASHFMDRSGKSHETESPRRYFCLQCHVQQAEVDPIVNNKHQSLRAAKGIKVEGE
ncbi:nitrate reductase cytochrome c-type subunit [Cricetibacter osteomyelitidis]|nr:nitrate reductase cytochrome c-type subunit [Cricetibacter osteomyelitidis]